jgi:hypothetical protein
MAGDGAAEVGEFLDGLAGLRPDDDQGPEPGRRRGRERPGGFESLQSNTAGRPVACTLPAAAALLGVPLPRVRQAAATLAPTPTRTAAPAGAWPSWSGPWDASAAGRGALGGAAQGR